MSTGCKSSHSGFLDVSRSNGGLRISGWIGQLSCLKIFSNRLSVAAFLHRAGGLMLESTGRHGRGVERRVPEMRRKPHHKSGEADGMNLEVDAKDEMMHI